MSASSQPHGWAGGKLILFGEHAVVHGTLALAMGLAQGIQICASKSRGPMSLRVKDWSINANTVDDSNIGLALCAICTALDIPAKNIALCGSADLPARAGLGSSAALACAVTRALCSYLETTISNEDLFQVIQASEKVFHGNPSGLDAAVSLEGGLVSFSREKGASKIDAEPPQLFIVHSMEPKNTAVTVAAFTDRLKKEAEMAQPRLVRIGEIVDEALPIISQGDNEHLGLLMNENHEILKWFGVSSQRLDELCRIARESGAPGAKMTGGGGGGCAIVLRGDNDLQVRQALTKAGFQVIE